MLNRFYLVPRRNVAARYQAISLFGGIGSGLLISLIILYLSGVPLSAVINEFVIFVFFDSAGFALTLTSFIPLVLVGLAASAAIKLNFWNIGFEGQMWVGAVAATFVATYDIGPDAIRFPLMFAAAILGGAFWVGIPALLKLRWGVNEIITTFLLSYVAFLLVQHLLFGIWRDPDSGFPASPPYEPGVEQLSKLGWDSLHSGLWIAIGAIILLWWLMNRSRLGFYMRAVGYNANAASAFGIPLIPTVVGAVILSGGLSGLAGMIIVAGQEHRLTVHIADGFTFSAVVIAFLARFNPLGVAITALVIAGFYTAGDTLKVFYQLSEAIVTLIESVILLCVLIAEFFSRYHIGIRSRAII